MSFYQFASDSPFLTFFLAVLVLGAVEVIAFRLPNRIIRACNIRAKGWPPDHLDADGDWKPKEH